MVSLLRLLLVLWLLQGGVDNIIIFVESLASSSSTSSFPPNKPSPRQHSHDHKQHHDNHYDVIIIGGSFAGLSTALTLGRSNDNVLIIDSNQPCNVDQPLSYNFLTQDGISPTELLERAKADVMKYPTIQWLNGHATGIQDIAEEDDSTSTETTILATTTLFEVQVDIVNEHDNAAKTIEEEEEEEEEGTDGGGEESNDGHSDDVSGQQLLKTCFTCHKIVLATGMHDMLPTHIPGLQECWGKSVLHCPYWYVLLYCVICLCFCVLSSFKTQVNPLMMMSFVLFFSPFFDFPLCHKFIVMDMNFLIERLPCIWMFQN